MTSESPIVMTVPPIRSNLKWNLVLPLFLSCLELGLFKLRLRALLKRRPILC